MRILKRDVVCLASDLAVGLSAYVITFHTYAVVGWLVVWLCVADKGEETVTATFWVWRTWRVRPSG
jgi:hypothetical protein